MAEKKIYLRSKVEQRLVMGKIGIRNPSKEKRWLRFWLSQYNGKELLKTRQQILNQLTYAESQTKHQTKT